MRTGGYKIESLEVLKDLLMSKNRGVLDCDYQLDNHAFVFELAEDLIVLLPSTLDNKDSGIVFYDKFVFKEIVSSGIFPVKIERNKKLFEDEYLRLNQIDSNYEHYENMLNDYLSDSLDYSNLHSIEKVHTKIVSDGLYKGNYKILEAYLIIVGFYILKNSSELSWQLKAEYAVYNRYLTPGIKNFRTQKVIYLHTVLSCMEADMDISSIIKFINQRLSE